MGRALVLSGGGSKGAYQVGAIRALLESGRSWDAVYGISVGALNAAWLSMFRPEEQAGSIEGLYAVWAQVKTSRDIYRPWLPFGLNYIASMWKGSLNSGAPLRALVSEFWDEDRARASGVKLSVGCVSLTTTRYRAITQDSTHIKEYVLASSHLPIVFEPLEIDGELWIDGGLRHQIPFLDALKDGHEEIDVVITQPIVNYDTAKVENCKIVSAPSVSLRGAAIFSDQVYFEDCVDVLRVVQAKSHQRAGMRVNLYVPSILPNSDSMDFDGSTIQRVVEMGYLETSSRITAALAGIDPVSAEHSSITIAGEL